MNFKKTLFDQTTSSRNYIYSNYTEYLMTITDFIHFVANFFIVNNLYGLYLNASFKLLL